MLTSTLESLDYAAEYPDLVGRRVLVSGIRGPVGIEVARLLAEQKVRIVLQADQDGPETNALAEIVAASALDVRLFAGPLADPDAMLRFARTAVQSFGGLDAVVNIAHAVEPEDGSEKAVERAVTAMLAVPCLVSRVAANRMRTTMTAGTILNMIALPRRAPPRTRIAAAIARTTLAELTRRDATTWGPDGIRINAVAPDLGLVAAGGSTAVAVTGAADLATLAVHLASDRGSRLSGLVFEGWAG